MMKLVTEKADVSQANYVGFIKWLNTGFVKLENPSGQCLKLNFSDCFSSTKVS